MIVAVRITQTGIVIKMNTFRSMEEFEKRYFPKDVEKYPVVFRCRVTQEEANAIDDWIRNRRANSYAGDE
jgi:hypothetical protein